MGQTCTTAHDAAEMTILPEQPRRKFGWKRDIPDIRDRTLVFRDSHKENLPSKVDLRPKEHFPIYDQGTLGSCTANAIGAAFHFEQVRQGIPEFVPSRLFIYYNERAMEGNIDQDAGAYIRDGIKSLVKWGVCNEKVWPYDESTFTDKPSDKAYKEALPNKALEYARVPQTLEDLKACINEGYPFAFGFAVYSSFQCVWTGVTGRMTMPWPCCDVMMGGHAVQACGYDDERQVFIVRNSWGESWGDKGYFYMPYDYMTNPKLCEDFWAIKFVSSQEFPTDQPASVFLGAGSCFGPTRVARAAAGGGA